MSVCYIHNPLSSPAYLAATAAGALKMQALAYFLTTAGPAVGQSTGSSVAHAQSICALQLEEVQPSAALYRHQNMQQHLTTAHLSMPVGRPVARSLSTVTASDPQSDSRQLRCMLCCCRACCSPQQACGLASGRVLLHSCCICI